MLHGLDLFSGIGGISLALAPWVRTVAYCERDPYAQAVLLQRMADGQLDRAPIWDDVTSLRGSMLPPIDLIYGGFPCQDISAAGTGKGLDGERSGLFFEIVRLASEVSPRFIFLENVPAIKTRGLDRVCLEITRLGYDLRWTTVSAAEFGAPHLRKRWFLLAHAHGDSVRDEQGGSSGESGSGQAVTGNDGENRLVAHSDGTRLEELDRLGHGQAHGHAGASGVQDFRHPWTAEPCLRGADHGLPHRVDRIKCLGNSVVPLQAQEAFKRLCGL